MTDLLPNVSLDAAGLVTIAEITAIARRTALTGTSVLSDMFVLCPGLHRQQSAAELSRGEYPAAAAMTTGYIFRVENPATVCFLQRIGRTGHLTTLHVCPPPRSESQGPIKQKAQKSRLARCKDRIPHLQLPAGLVPGPGPREEPIVSIAYLGAVGITLAMLTVYFYLHDWWGVFCLLALVLARLCNIIVIRRRCSSTGWKGAPEPGVDGDLLVLLSGDSWIRIRGAVDDLKAVTAGQWMRDRTVGEDVVSAVATLLVYISAVLVCNIAKIGQILLLSGMVVSAGLLFLANAATTTMSMNGRQVRVSGVSQRYFRRRDLAEELVKESGRADWARRLGMIAPDSLVQGQPEGDEVEEEMVDMKEETVIL